jgi:hypothetical protein
VGFNSSSGDQHTQYVQYTLEQSQGGSLLSGVDMHDAMSPRDVIRESRKSLEHPNPTTVLVAFDETGSMGDIPEKIMTDPQGLAVLFDALQTKIPHPQLGFAGVGDSQKIRKRRYTQFDTNILMCDDAPFQFEQFESDNRAADNLSHIWREGGGGGNGGESYHLAWWFAYNQCILDSWGQGRKGIIITVGDECVHPELTPEEVQTVLHSSYAGPGLTNDALLARVQERFVVFHICINNERAQEQQSLASWQVLLGEQVFIVEDTQNIAQAIVGVILDDIMPMAQARWDMEPIPQRLLTWSPAAEEPWHVPPVKQVHMLELSLKQGFLSLLKRDDINLQDTALKTAARVCVKHINEATEGADVNALVQADSELSAALRVALQQIDLNNQSTQVLVSNLADELNTWHQLREDAANQDAMPAQTIITPGGVVVPEASASSSSVTQDAGYEDEDNTYDPDILTQRY